MYELIEVLHREALQASTQCQLVIDTTLLLICTLILLCHLIESDVNVIKLCSLLSCFYFIIIRPMYLVLSLIFLCCWLFV